MIFNTVIASLVNQNPAMKLALLTFFVAGFMLTSCSQISLPQSESNTMQAATRAILSRSSTVQKIIEAANNSFRLTSVEDTLAGGYQNSNGSYAWVSLNPTGTVQVGVEIEDGRVIGTLLERVLPNGSHEVINLEAGIATLYTPGAASKTYQVDVSSATTLRTRLENNVRLQDSNASIYDDGDGGSTQRSRCSSQATALLNASENLADASDNFTTARLEMAAGIATGGGAGAFGDPATFVIGAVGGLAATAPNAYQASAELGRARRAYNNAAVSMRACL